MFCEIGGLKIHYIEEGSGEPVVLLHGWGSSIAPFSGIIRLLKQKYRVLAVEFPGCGESETMKTPWNLDDYAAFTLAFLQKVGAENPILIGHSHGGRVILRLAGRGDISPKKIVLLDSAGLIPKKSFRQKMRIRSFKAVKRVLTLPPFKNHTEGLLQKARQHYGSSDYNSCPQVLRETMVRLVNTDVRELLPQISCPVLLIWGEKDTDTPLADAKVMAGLLPDAGLCVIPGAGHFSFLQDPGRVAAILTSFLM